MNKLVIAVDGYSSCGKSTFAKAIAAKLQYRYIDSGAMYRSVALHCFNNNAFNNGQPVLEKVLNLLDEIQIDFKYNSAIAKSETWLNNINVDKEIRSLEISNLVSPISKIKEVREKMVSLQREMGKEKAIVMDGRDIGTVVFPNAELKIFMTADAEVRAKRRYDEMLAKGEEANFNEIAANIKQRDFLDETREESPLRKADDAIVLDNGNMTPDEQMIWFDKILRKLPSKL